MKIAVLSGKGGTGKTFVSVNLACVGENAVYVDCDVEEPNGHLFFKPEIKNKFPISVSVPKVDTDKCVSCRKCVDFCKYNALAIVKNKLLIFHEICHSCGGCVLFCPEKALSEKERQIGEIEEGFSSGVKILTGRLNTGEVSGVPIIKKLIKMLPEKGDVLIDCPPGSACTVMESIRKADFCVLVTEPTLFGAHNLKMVYDLILLFGKPFGVVINKNMPETSPVDQFCAESNIKILEKIPFSEHLGRLNSEGKIVSLEDKHYFELFKGLLKTIKKEALS
ncbi:MAG: ATP-binding protein [Lachnospiraceae bacterium]|nr:ATP-binding protein [Lachnospiraceae bacterium]